MLKIDVRNPSKKTLDLEPQLCMRRLRSPWSVLQIKAAYTTTLAVVDIRLIYIYTIQLQLQPIHCVRMKEGTDHLSL